ncbi:SDR family NAD(P)-dependent oxidoreductase [Kitasatospora sp. NPDC004240]
MATGLPAEELTAFSRTLGRLRALPADDPARLRAEREAESFVREGRKQRRRDRREDARTTDAELVAATATGHRDRREDAPLELPAGGRPAPIGEFRQGRRCYVCKTMFRQVDGFYHLLCPDCAADNATRRGLSTDLHGRRALLTGGRVKIGFQLALMMLRDGAELIVTSRFPHDTVRRFRAEPGSGTWWPRLTVVGIDLRDPRQVLGLSERLRAEGRPLDILVNNAAQTLRRPPESYALLAAGEHTELPAADAGTVTHAPGFRPMPALSPAWPAAELASPAGEGAQVRADGTGEAGEGVMGEAAVGEVTVGEGAVGEGVMGGTAAGAGVVLPEVGGAGTVWGTDEAGLLPDLAHDNSWSARLGGLDPSEVLETQLVNALAPALLCDRLLPLLLASPYANRYIVNVTAVEGRFAVRNKTAGHPHTNMAKAALNMLTRTSAAELATQGVHMCAVDTGWITDENPAPKKSRLATEGFRTPLDIVDGAARVYDPIVRGEAGAPVSGVFLKDYREAEW